MIMRLKENALKNVINFITMSQLFHTKDITPLSAENVLMIVWSAKKVLPVQLVSAALMPLLTNLAMKKDALRDVLKEAIMTQILKSASTVSIIVKLATTALLV